MTLDAKKLSDYDKQFRNGCWQIIKKGQPGMVLFAVNDRQAADRLLAEMATGKTIKEITQPATRGMQP